MVKDFYADNRLTITATAISDIAKILDQMNKGGIAASLELIKSVQSSIKELCTLMLSFVGN